MKEHPILFSAPMVRAILDGRKTMTRRLVKPQPVFDEFGCWYPDEDSKKRKHYAQDNHFRKGLAIDFAKYKPGDLIWVKETFCYTPIDMGCRSHKITYKADGSSIELLAPNDVTGPNIRVSMNSDFADYDRGHYGAWRSSIHMPRCASRITLEVLDVKVERLHDICEDDAINEGMNGGCLNCGRPQPCNCKAPYPDYVDSFAWTWESIYGPGSWADNPWVFCYEFQRVK
jgi:hypothetical protein